MSLQICILLIINGSFKNNENERIISHISKFKIKLHSIFAKINIYVKSILHARTINFEYFSNYFEF